MRETSGPAALVGYAVDRRRLATVEAAEGPIALAAARARSTFDRLAIPDGTPFALDTGGNPHPVDDINDYVVSAVRARAFQLVTAKSTAYHLLRALRFVRTRASEPSSAGAPLRLVEATTDDIVAYRDHRRTHISARSWNTELSALSAFFDWAVADGHIDRNPVPRWGARQRSTLKAREELLAAPRFLTERQLRAFLNLGLRGDGQPSMRLGERDYAFGLALVSTGLRREEAAMLLDLEVPTLSRMPSDGVHEFTRYGKLGRPRRVFVTSELAQAMDLYRSTTRRHLIEHAQPTLRRRRRADQLLIVDHVRTDARGRTTFIIDGAAVLPELLSNADRQRAVTLAADGSIEPLGLFVTRFGLPARMASWNAVFSAAEERIRNDETLDQPPAHLRVTPHTMRHTFAVRMLAALMRLGRERASNPYHLLASPLITVQQLLGHASPETTRRYLIAAETYDDLLPSALREHAAKAIGTAS